MDRWENKIAIVTGATAGIGAAVVEVLVKEGIWVVGLARRQTRLEELSKKLQSEKGKFHGLRCDVTKEEEILNSFLWVEENLGPISILVNNAGICKNTSFLEGHTEILKEILDTNFVAASIATREAIKSMRRSSIDGHVIFMNSILGHYIPTGYCSNMYASSKHALTALVETLRIELVQAQSKIKITSLSPGFVKTEILEANDIPPSKELDFLFQTALNPEDVANVVKMILSTPPHLQIHELIMRGVGELM